MNRKSEWTDPKVELPDDHRIVQAVVCDNTTVIRWYNPAYKQWSNVNDPSICAIPKLWKDLDEAPASKPMIDRWWESLSLDGAGRMCVDEKWAPNEVIAKSCVKSYLAFAEKEGGKE